MKSSVHVRERQESDDRVHLNMVVTWIIGVCLVSGSMCCVHHSQCDLLSRSEGNAKLNREGLGTRSLVRSGRGGVRK